jgi:arylsulfatase A-like enzyme
MGQRTGFLRNATVLCVGAVVLASCSGGERPPAAAKEASPRARPSILLVTLDTTRWDAIGPEARGARTPGFDALAARGLRFRQAYATAPETLPSHASMLTGLYPAGHGVRENARYLAPAHPVAAEKLRAGGYRTAAFVSSFVLARRFGLARGFEHYDDALPERRSERSARETTDRALAWLEGGAGREPLFLWVHYFDPHAPYEPPEPYRSRHPRSPYLGEVEAMDEQLGRLVAALEGRSRGPVAIVVASDHGEGLGDHGEAQHGNLVYQSTMLVPVVIAGPGVVPGTSDVPVSTRRVFHTLLDWAGLGEAHSLRRVERELVLGEAMKPFLSYGWQPQVMGVEGPVKAILAGRLLSPRSTRGPRRRRSPRTSGGSSRASATSPRVPRPWCGRTPPARPT